MASPTWQYTRRLDGGIPSSILGTRTKEALPTVRQSGSKPDIQVQAWGFDSSRFRRDGMALTDRSPNVLTWRDKPSWPTGCSLENC